MRHLEGHYRPKTIEIAERFKFFKRSQQKSEKAAEVVRKEEVMQDSHKEKEDGATYKIRSAKLECYRCGKPNHSPLTAATKMLHAMFAGKQAIWPEYADHGKRSLKTPKAPSKKTGVHYLQESDIDSSYVQYIDYIDYRDIIFFISQYRLKN